jgi:hypothetical protein
MVRLSTLRRILYLPYVKTSRHLNERRDKFSGAITYRTIKIRINNGFSNITRPVSHVDLLKPSVSDDKNLPL